MLRFYYYPGPPLVIRILCNSLKRQKDILGGVMQAAARVREHQVVFCGLEVLRLIGERMENENEVDTQDIQLVLDFMRDVVHRCLDNTEEILRFASLEQH